MIMVRCKVIPLLWYWSVDYGQGGSYCHSIGLLTTVEMDQVIILPQYWSVMTTVKVDKAIILPQYWSVDYGQDGQSDDTTTVLVCDDYGQGGQGVHTAILLVC